MKTETFAYYKALLPFIGFKNDKKNNLKWLFYCSIEIYHLDDSSDIQERVLA